MGSHLDRNRSGKNVYALGNTFSVHHPGAQHPEVSTENIGAYLEAMKVPVSEDCLSAFWLSADPPCISNVVLETPLRIYLSCVQPAVQKPERKTWAYLEGKEVPVPEDALSAFGFQQTHSKPF